MPRWLQVGLHAALIGVNGTLTYKALIPPRWSVALMVAQGVLGYVAQQYNTAGTPQSTPGPK